MSLPQSTQITRNFAPGGSVPDLIEGPHSLRRYSGLVPTRLADLAENILDTTHTSIVHAGQLRRLDTARPVQPRVRAGPDWIEAEYPPAATPNGWMAHLIGGPRYTIRDRFQAPSIAEVTYTDEKGKAFAIRFFLQEAEGGHVKAEAVMAVRGRGLWAALKLTALRLLLARIIAEDRQVLAAASENRACNVTDKVLLMPQDLLRSGIEAILRGETPVAPRRVPVLMI